jgi:hypothetical protein
MSDITNNTDDALTERERKKQKSPWKQSHIHFYCDNLARMENFLTPAASLALLFIATLGKMETYINQQGNDTVVKISDKPCGDLGERTGCNADLR